MALFRSKPRDLADTTARDYLATAPPGARSEVLAGACVLGTMDLGVAAPERHGSLVTYAELAEVDHLVQGLLYQDDDFAAMVARKIAFNIRAAGAISGRPAGEWLSANGVKLGEHEPLEVVDGQDDPDGTGQSLAGLFWMTFRAVALGQSDAGADWRFYASLYTDPERHGLNYSVIAWGALTTARLLNIGALSRSVFGYGDEFRTVPRLTGPGWYPHPSKAGRLPNGDAPVKCYWDGDRWTDRCRVWSNGRFRDITRSPHAPPMD